MSSPAYEPPLRLELRRSRQLAVLLALTHGGALVLLSAVPLPVIGRLLLAAAVLVSLAATWARHLRPGPNGAVSELIWKPDGGWILIAGGRPRACHLRPGCYVHPRCTILNFTGAARRSVLLLADNVDAEQFRRLRVRLGLQKQSI